MRDLGIRRTGRERRPEKQKIMIGFAVRDLVSKGVPVTRACAQVAGENDISNTMAWGCWKKLDDITPLDPTIESLRRGGGQPFYIDDETNMAHDIPSYNRRGNRREIDPIVRDWLVDRVSLYGTGNISALYESCSSELSKTSAYIPSLPIFRRIAKWIEKNG